MQISSFKTVKTRITSGEGECPCKRARTSRILASSRESRSKPGPMPSFPFNNWQPRFYTSMQIKHKTPFIWLGLPPTTAKGKTGFSKAVFFQAKPYHTLKSPKTCLFVGILRGIVCQFCRRETLARVRPITEWTVPKRPWKSIKWVAPSSHQYWTIFTIWYCIMAQHLPYCNIIFHICARRMMGYHKVSQDATRSESLLWYQDASSEDLRIGWVGLFGEGLVNLYVLLRRV